MGRSYLFECTKCGYKAKVSGGTDEGLNCCIQTILCRDCHKLYDSVIRLKVRADAGRGIVFGHQPVRTRGRRSGDVPPAFEAVINRLPPASAKRFRWIQFKICCPVSAAHRVQIWNDPGKCPQCAHYLEKSAPPFRIWD